MYEHNWHDCNFFCYTYLGIDGLVLLSHYAINIFLLYGWANGSILLLFNSYFTTWITMFSALLMIGEPTVMLAPYEFRLSLFIISSIVVSLFIGNLTTILVKYLLGTTPTDSFSEIINMYIAILQLGAFIPSLFILLYEGLAFTPYSIFNSKYGDWDNLVLPG